MEREYEKILHVSGDVAVGGSPDSTVPLPHHPLSHQGSLDLVLAKMAEASQHWEEVGMTITMENKEHLQEFGLNPLEIQCPGDPREQDRLSAPTCLSAHLESFPHPLPHTPAAPG